jgi:hypothetical protein
MNTVEDRLTAALAARAGLVVTEDLTHAPPVAPRAPLLRRPTTYLLAAAACAAAVAVPFVLGGGPGDEGTELPPETQQPDPTPAPNGHDVPGAGWTEAYSYARAYDVDGDGAPDRLVVRTEAAESLPPGTRRVEVHLTTGGVAAVLLDYETYDLTAIEPVELDGEPGDEVLYYRGTSDGRDIGVLDLVGGALVDLEVPEEPGLTHEPDADFHARGWWVEDRLLRSYRTVEDGFVPGGTFDGNPPHEVDVWTWRLAGGELGVVPEGRQCWDGADAVQPC